MLLPRELVKYLRTTTLDPFGPRAGEALQGDPSAAVLLWEAAATGTGIPAILLALQTLRVAGYPEPATTAAEFVATVPPGVTCPARPTAVVLREMLSAARSEVFALGYEITEGGVITLLHEAALHCPHITLMCDRERGSAARLRAGWPPDRHRAVCYENQEGKTHPAYSSMHCKTLLVDGTDLLITSANFTFHGLGGNIEFGVRLRGLPAQAARPILVAMLNSGLFREVTEQPAGP